MSARLTKENETWEEFDAWRTNYTCERCGNHHLNKGRYYNGTSWMFEPDQNDQHELYGMCHYADCTRPECIGCRHRRDPKIEAQIVRLRNRQANIIAEIRIYEISNPREAECRAMEELLETENDPLELDIAKEKLRELTNELSGPRESLARWKEELRTVEALLQKIE